MITVLLYQTKWSRANKKYGQEVGRAENYQEFCKLVENAQFYDKFLAYEDESGNSLAYHEVLEKFGERTDLDYPLSDGLLSNGEW